MAVTMAKDLYQVLGVPRAASDKEIRSAYRKLARQYHPDVNPNDKAAETRFKEITAAYEVLGEPENRSKYDKYGDQWEHADQIEEMRRQQGGRSWSSSGPGASTFHFESNGDGDFGSIFENIFRRGGGAAGPRPSSPRRGQDIDTPVEITLEEAFNGTTRLVNLGERRIEVKVPPGVKTGSRVRVAGEGAPGANGGSQGDLFLVITVRSHPRFERKGDDLYVDVDVPVYDAVLGGEVEVPTVDGRVLLRVKELTQNGTQVRLAGKGMPVLGKPGTRGDLYARIRVKVPTALTPEQRELFEQLRKTSEAVAS